MRSGPATASVAPMGTPPLKMTIELDPGEPISGRIECAGRPAQRFRGWLELSNRLEHLRADAAPASPPPPDEKGPPLD